MAGHVRQIAFASATSWVRSSPPAQTSLAGRRVDHDTQLAMSSLLVWRRSGRRRHASVAAAVRMSRTQALVVGPRGVIGGRGHPDPAVPSHYSKLAMIGLWSPYFAESGGCSARRWSVSPPAPQTRRGSRPGASRAWRGVGSKDECTSCRGCMCSPQEASFASWRGNRVCRSGTCVLLETPVRALLGLRCTR